MHRSATSVLGACLATFLLVGVMPLAAQAATISRTVTCDKYGCDSTAHLLAAAGERNQIVSHRDSDGLTLIVSDTGAPLTAARSCMQIDANSVRCAPGASSGGIGLNIAAGDGDDTIDVRETNGSVDAGTGNDTVVGSSQITGGPGSDVLVGAPNGASADYSDHTTPIIADLASGDVIGTDGEHDRLTGISTVFGGDGNDVLLGNDLSNTLVGGPGDDLVDGRGGDDQLVGDLSGVPRSPRNGRDRLIGGTGNDSLDGGESPSRSDTLDCGDGQDSVSISYSRGGVGADLVLPGCEQVNGAMQGPFPLFVPLIADDAPIITVDMGGYAGTNHLAARLRDGTLVADRRIYLNGGNRERTIGLRLNATGRRLLRATGALTVRVVVDKLTNRNIDVGRFRYHDEFRTTISLATR